MTQESNERVWDPHFRERVSELLAELERLIPQVEQCAGPVDEINDLAEERRRLEEKALSEVSEETVELQKRAQQLGEEIASKYQPVNETSCAVCAFIRRLDEALELLPAEDPLRQQIARLGVYRDAVLFKRVSLTKATPDLRRIQELLGGVPPVRRKRGRPSRIPDERKEQALAAKRAGASNREVARILYGVKHPSPSQIRAVPAILHNYERRKAARAQSPESLRTVP